MKVGEVEILPVLDGVLVSKLPSTKPLPDPQSWVWQHQGGMFRHDGMKESSLGGFLVRTGDHLVLVDAGAGPGLSGGYTPPVLDLDDPSDRIMGFFRNRGVPEERMREIAANLQRIELTHGELPASLEALGVHPDQVTDLVFTHLHFDHIGWASVDNRPFFANATIRCAAADLEYFLAEPQEDWFSSQVFQAPLVPDRLRPILDRVETWEGDSSLFAGVDVRLTPGHTPGSSVVVVSSGPERAMLLGDVVHCPLELQDDDFNFLGDHDQALANQVREAYARELEGSEIPVAAAHFPGLRFGRLLPGQGVRRWSFNQD
jgi:glyoxylase-like metal-dependent hydrolase (beta-lactamase superfamily II)